MDQATTTASRHSISELEKLFQEADEQDKELFAEQRSNILMYSGEHYNRLRSTYYKRIRETKTLTEDQRIRLTKNHTQKIVDSYTNHLLSSAPGVGFEPANDSELQDQKTAELNHSVWENAKEKYVLDEQTQDWAEDFTQIGEVATKIFWDPMEGQFLGSFLGEDGAMEPHFSGDFVFEEIFGFNLLIDKAATNHRKAKWMCIRKMVDVKTLKKMFGGKKNPENDKFIQEGADQTYTIFDRGRAGYAKTKDQCMLREMYFRPCFEYPSGYVYYFVKDKILFESELPAGRFPIVFKPFRKMKTRARGQSIIKTIRPFQVEINRAASKIAEHQITLGDDKVITFGGATLTSGKVLPGVRSYNVSGQEPKILAGRDGSQYASYMLQQITEMYNACDVEEKDEPMNGQIDPYSLLYASAKQKRKFKLYVGRFEQYLIEVAKLFLDLARYHYPDDMVIGMVGRKEKVNMEEFRGTDPLCYKIKVVAQSDDIETKLGKQLVLSQGLQYTASKLEREDIGKIFKAMPYGNSEEVFSDLTIDYEAATNDILALDRGELPPIGQYDNHKYMIKRLTQRMRQADFRFLEPQIQQAYAQRLAAHEQAEAAQVAAIQRAESGFIPTTGYLVSCDFYVQVPNSTGGTKDQRVRLPSDALQWLIKKLEDQGTSMDGLEKMNQGNLAQIAGMVSGPDGSQAPPAGQQQAQGSAGGEANGRAANAIPSSREQPVFAQ
jgi:hypothetical protein